MVATGNAGRYRPIRDSSIAQSTEGIPSAYAREAQSAGYRDRSRPNSRRAVAKLETSSTAARRETTEIHYAENCISRFVPGGSDESYGPNATR
jgi:hypothetical protein